MEALSTLGVAGSTPFVVQFLLDLFPGVSAKMGAFEKRTLSILTGAVLGVLLHVYTGGSLTLTPELYTAVINGAVDGALATAGVSLVHKVAKKAGATN
jgi:hypothetical protein